MLIRLLQNVLLRIVSGLSTRSSLNPIGQIDEFVADGAAQHRAGLYTKAEAAYRNALKRNPSNPDAMHLLGVIALHRRDLDGAEEWVAKALSICPRSAVYLNTLASILSSMGRHVEARARLEAALQIEPNAYRPLANLLFLLNIIPGISRQEIFSRHLDWASKHADVKPAEGRQFFAGVTRSQSVLRIGYVSADFCAHPVGRIISSVLKFHNRQKVEVFCYDNGSDKDELNKVCQKNVDHWIDISVKTDTEVAERIGADGIHILVDLSGHTRKNRLTLFARKPAPVQVTWLGYLNTTGLSTIDWRLTDKRADPAPQSQLWHIERLWYLPNAPWVWDPPSMLKKMDVSPSPCISKGFVTFGSFNTFRKLNDSVVTIWGEILRCLPKARLRIYGTPPGSTVDRMIDLFRAKQVDEDRIDFIAALDYDRYLQSYGDVDIALDPFPYNGGATTCESLWMGVPVVSLAGAGGFARSGASLLGATGLDMLVAQTPSEYVDIAVRLARDPEGLAGLRFSLREKIASSPLADTEGFVRDLENAYEGMWKIWQGGDASIQTKRV